MTKCKHYTKDRREEIPLDELLTIEKRAAPADSRNEQSDPDDDEEDEYDVMNRIEKQDKQITGAAIPSSNNDEALPGSSGEQQRLDSVNERLTSEHMMTD